MGFAPFFTTKSYFNLMHNTSSNHNCSPLTAEFNFFGVAVTQLLVVKLTSNKPMAIQLPKKVENTNARVLRLILCRCNYETLEGGSNNINSNKRYDSKRSV